MVVTSNFTKVVTSSEGRENKNIMDIPAKLSALWDKRIRIMKEPAVWNMREAHCDLGMP